MPAILLLSLALAVVTPGGMVGAAACGSCHPKIYESWRLTAHARAASTDVLGSSSTKAACLSCHATGEGVAAQKRQPGVQCEACHGPGGSYATADVMRDLPLARSLGLTNLEGPAAAEAVCRRCHRPETRTRPDAFDFARDWKKIAH